MRPRLGFTILSSSFRQRTFWEISPKCRPFQKLRLLWTIFLPLTIFAQQQSPAPQTAQITSTGRVVTAPPDVAAPSVDAQTMASGLAMKVLNPGSGPEHRASNACVTVGVMAWKTDGTVFPT